MLRIKHVSLFQLGFVLGDLEAQHLVETVLMKYIVFWYKITKFPKLNVFELFDKKLVLNS